MNAGVLALRNECVTLGREVNPLRPTVAFAAEMVEATVLDKKEKHKLRSFARQFIDAMSPANFGATNPEVIKLALESGGDSVRVSALVRRRAATLADGPLLVSVQGCQRRR